jgi:cytochrome c-type biogenesis protein CcmH/NrfF
MTSPRATRFALGFVLAALLLSAFPAFAQQSARAKSLGHKLKCICGCNQILAECNHVGCKYSHDMLAELDSRVARNEPDDLTLQAFVQEYGAEVLLLPKARGFNLWAWIMPVLLPLLALALLPALILRWRKRAVLAPAGQPSPELLDRVRREERNWSDL